MSSELTVEQVADYILAAPNDQEFFNRADQYLTGHHTDLDRARDPRPGPPSTQVTPRRVLVRW